MVMNYKKRGEKMNLQKKPKVQPLKISEHTKKEIAGFGCPVTSRSLSNFVGDYV